jgi:GNAT superfamily N-acetyltransferase
LGYALCSVQARAANVFSPPVRRLMIDQIAVAPAARRKGYGRALLDAARGLARDLAVDEILLDTWEANHDAHAFFRAAGFAPRRMLFRALP